MSNFERMFPSEQRALRILGTGATVAGTTNTNVIAFTGAAAAWQSLKGNVPGTNTYPLGTTFVAPTEGSGNWLNTVNSATAGTGFKFNRRGIYQVDVYADGTSGDTGNSQIGITMDQIAGLDTVAAGTVATLSDSILAFQNNDGVAAAAIPVHASAPVFITDTMAGGAQPSTDLTTTRGVGVLRFIANNAGNAVVATAWVVATIRATIVCQNDLCG